MKNWILLPSFGSLKRETGIMTGKNKNLFPIILFAIFFIFIIVACTNKQTQADQPKPLNNNVMILDWDTDTGKANLINMDIAGDYPQIVQQNMTGTVAWSNDGNYIAVGCNDIRKLCIYDANMLIKSNSKYTHDKLDEFALVQKISIPIDCIESVSERGLSSISWSKNDKNLAIVCENHEKSNLCILNVNGESYCWGEKNKDINYSRVDWSPIDDSLLIDTGKQIFIDGKEKIEFILLNHPITIVDENGQLIRILLDGWSPEWSPDGQKIAFFRWDEEREYAGLGIMDSDGSNFKWVYRPPARGSNDKLEYTKLTFSESYYGATGSSKVSWSPDNKFLIVEAEFTDIYTYRIFRIDISSGEITPITSDSSYSVQEPDIRPTN